MGVFRCYVSEDETDVIEAWLSGQPDAVRGEVKAVLLTLDAMPQNQWPEALWKALDDRAGSKCAGLDEIILKVGMVHFRILGWRGPRETQFTMLYPFKKNGNPYTEGCAQAHERKQEVQSDWKRSREFRLG